MRETIAKRIGKTFEKYNIVMSYTIEKKSLNQYQSYAAFNPVKNMIFFREEGILKEWKQLKQLDFSFSFKEFIEIVSLHEIGHMMDKEISFFHEDKKKLLKQISSNTERTEFDHIFESLTSLILKSESNAWDYVERKMTVGENYHRYKKMCYRRYIEYLNSLYERLLHVKNE